MVYFCTLVEMCPSNCCCDCGQHVREQAGGPGGSAVFPLFLLACIQKGSGKEGGTCCQSLIVRGEFMVFGFLIRLSIFPSSN